jgi:hypothetical protein
MLTGISQGSMVPPHHAFPRVVAAEPSSRSFTGVRDGMFRFSSPSPMPSLHFLAATSPDRPPQTVILSGVTASRSEAAA